MYVCCVLNANKYFLLSYLLACLLAYLLTYLLTRTYLLAYLLTYLLTRTYLLNGVHQIIGASCMPGMTFYWTIV